MSQMIDTSTLIHEIKSLKDRIVVLENNLQIYDTGWINLADWTDATVIITHSLDTAFTDLTYRIYWSASGADGADNYDITNMIKWDDPSHYGSILHAGADDDNVIFQTGGGGAVTFSAAGGSTTITSGYYRIILSKKIV